MGILRPHDSGRRDKAGRPIKLADRTGGQAAGAGAASLDAAVAADTAQQRRVPGPVFQAELDACDQGFNEGMERCDDWSNQESLKVFDPQTGSACGWILEDRSALGEELGFKVVRDSGLESGLNFTSVEDAAGHLRSLKFPERSRR